MPRRLLAIMWILSLLLCLGVMVLWAQSHVHPLIFRCSVLSDSFVLGASDGSLEMARMSHRLPTVTEELAGFFLVSKSGDLRPPVITSSQGARPTESPPPPIITSVAYAKWGIGIPFAAVTAMTGIPLLLVSLKVLLFRLRRTRFASCDAQGAAAGSNLTRNTSAVCQDRRTPVGGRAAGVGQIRRRLFNLTSIVSLLVCAAVSLCILATAMNPAAWTRQRDTSDEIETRKITMRGGVLRVSLIVLPGRTAGESFIGWRNSESYGVWKLALVAAALPIIWLILSLHGRRATWKRENHRCMRCSYDLTGNVSGVCPECGTRIRESMAQLP